MTIAHDAVSNIALTSGDLSWTHTPTGTPRGVVVLVVHGSAATDSTTGATYGGVTMTEVAGSPLLHSVGSEDGACYGYFLGAAVPTGAQTVLVSATSGNKRAIAATMTAAGDTQVEDTTTLDSGAVTDPSVVLTIANLSQCYGVLHSGQDAVGSVTPGTGLTEILEYGLASVQVGNFARSTSTQAADFTFGWTAASDEAGVLAVAVSEIVVASTAAAFRPLVPTEAIRRAARW